MANIYYNETWNGYYHTHKINAIECNKYVNTELFINDVLDNIDVNACKKMVTLTHVKHTY